MADKVEVDVKVMQPSMQDTGNPVLDSLVNLFVACPGDQNAMRSVHALLLELAAKEPGGLKRDSSSLVE